jgi:hypothetical protein
MRPHGFRWVNRHAETIMRRGRDNMRFLLGATSTKFGYGRVHFDPRIHRTGDDVPILDATRCDHFFNLDFFSIKDVSPVLRS